jgi:hypothetical protein
MLLDESFPNKGTGSMPYVAPPHPPPAAVLADDDGMHRLAQRLRMVLLSLLTIVATAWCFTLGIVPGVLAAMVAKHVLVAILVMGLGVDRDRNDNREVGG